MRARQPSHRLSPVVTSYRAGRPAIAGLLTTRNLLALQRAVGNDRMRRIVATVQGCGGEVHEGCPCAESSEQAVPPVLSRQTTGPAAPSVCQPPGTRRVAGSDVDSVDRAVVDGCLLEAYAVLNGHAMFGLLPLLDALRTKASFAQIRATAGGMGGARMTVAIAAVDLKSGGGPITGTALRSLIDQLGGLPPDQRRDILRFLGKLVVITVQGFDIDFSYCRGSTSAGCTAPVQGAIRWARKMQREYAACRGKRGVRVANDVESCVDASLARQGIRTSVAGSTSPTGAVTITPTALSQCQPVLERGTEIHEAVHQRTTLRLQRRFGAGTPAFDRAFEAADKWINDDINAYGAEIPFYRAVLRAVAKLEGRI